MNWLVKKIHNPEPKAPPVEREPDDAPPDPAIGQWLDGLTDDARERFDERAGIREFDGGMTRREAERLTFADYAGPLAAAGLLVARMFDGELADWQTNTAAPETR